MILVTGATAPIGRSLVEQLLAAGKPVRALTRNPGTAGLPAGVEVAPGDLSEPETLPAALDGVSAVFLQAYVPGFAPAFLANARKAGVRRIVFQSSGAVRDDVAEQPSPIAASTPWLKYLGGIDWKEDCAARGCAGATGKPRTLCGQQL